MCICTSWNKENHRIAIHINAIPINAIPISLHLDTQTDTAVVTEKHYGKLGANIPYSKPA